MNPADRLPTIIQGGMGVAVSNWQLARAVSIRGQLGVVSGTALDTVLVRRLQDADSGGHMRRAMAHFPIPGVAEEVLEKFFRADGRADGTPYRLPTFSWAREFHGRSRVCLMRCRDIKSRQCDSTSKAHRRPSRST